MPRTPTPIDNDADANRVILRGRLSADPEPRALPSGDTLLLLRVSVPRPDASRTDSIPVVIAPPADGRRKPGQATRTTVRRAAGLSAGDTVRIEGWLQRRFWDAGTAGRVSRLQVVATDIARDE